MRRMGKVASVALGIVLLASGILFAQSSPKPGVVRGVVRDSNKGFIPGVQLRLNNFEKTIDFKSLSGKEGEFSFEIAPGEYQLAGELMGFQTSILGPVKVKEGETIRIELILFPANTNTTIEVNVEKVPFKLL